MLRRIWLVPALPLLASATNLFFGKRLRESSGWLAVLAVAVSFAVSLGALAQLLARAPAPRLQIVHLFHWISVGSPHVGVNMRVDPLSMTMILVVTGVGSLIHLFSIGDKHRGERY